MTKCPYSDAGVECSAIELYQREPSSYPYPCNEDCNLLRIKHLEENIAKREEFEKKHPKQTEKLENDPVNHPSHYTSGKIECIDFITDKKLNFCRGNAVKYIVRAGLKDKSKEIEDLEKAVFYINREIEELKKEEKENGTVEKG